MASVEIKEKLINLVRIHPELYDKQHLKYRDVACSRSLWKEFAKELQLTGMLELFLSNA